MGHAFPWGELGHLSLNLPQARQVRLLLMNKRGFRSSWVLVERTAGPSTSLRSGRDDKFIAPEILNCRSLGYARDDKGDGRAPIEDSGAGDMSPDAVHSPLNLPQASQIAP
jgi:hypothetical protein